MKKLASRKDARVIDLMIAFGPMGYGIYALLVDYLKERKAFRSIDDVNRIAYELHADAETLRAVITDFGLFEIVDGEITVKDIRRKKPVADAGPSESAGVPVDSEVPVDVVESPDIEVDSEPDSRPKEEKSSSQKRRERRKRLRLSATRIPVFIQKQE